MLESGLQNLFTSAYPSPHQFVLWKLVWWSRVHLQCRRPRFNCWVRKIPWRRKWQPTPVFLLGKFHGWRSLVNYSPWDHKESDITEQIHWFTGSHLHSKLCPSYISGPCWRPTARCSIIDHFSGQQNSYIIRLKFLLWTTSGYSFCIFFHLLHTYYRVGTLHLDK